MKLIKVNDYYEMSRKAASIIASQITLKPDSVLGLATGDTPLGMYNELVKLYNNKELDFSEVVSFNLDEYYGLDISNKQSYYYFMMNNLFKYINVPAANINIPNGSAENIQKECLRYEEKIKKAGGIDIQVLGIGVNGHIGFNEPDVNFEAKTHLVTLDKSTIQANSRFFINQDDVPTKAISMGIGTIMNSKKILLLACGSAKADIISKAVKGKITPEIPASILQLHQDVTVIVDAAAAVNL